MKIYFTIPSITPHLENYSWSRGSFHDRPLFRFPFPVAFNEKASLVSRLARPSKILDFGAPTRRRRWTRSSGNKLQAPLSSPSWLPLCLSLVPSLDLLLRISLPFLLSLCLLLFPITWHTRVRSLHTRGNAASKDAWPWTSRCFFEVSRTEIGRNHVDRVTLPCDFLRP